MASRPAYPSPATSSRPHRKRISLSRLSSDTTSSLPPYRPSLLVSEPSEQPPDYPDSADEADEETEIDDQITQLLSPPISPRSRRRRLLKPGQQPRATRIGGLYANHSTQSDIFLDKILERSVEALELSNNLLQSSMTTQVSLNHVLSPELPSPDESLGSRARLLDERIRGNSHARWMDDLDILARDVETLFEDKQRSAGTGGVDIPGRLNIPNKSPDELVSRSLPTSAVGIRRPLRCSAGLRYRGHSDCGRLRLTTDQRVFSASAPRALTQYVNADADFGGTHQSSLDASQSILLPSTTGLRSCSTLSNFSSPASSSTLVPAVHGTSPAYASLARQASRSPRSSRSPSASGSSSRTYRQRSSSRSSNQPPSPHLLPRIIPPPIEELPSQSDSSSSSSPHPLRTLESLRKILDEQPMQPTSPIEESNDKGKLSPRHPAFLPRSPPVEPVLSTSTTTTSISRLYTKGAHSTSTRPRSPPQHSSLKKQRPPPLDTTDNPNPNPSSSSTTSMSSLLRSPLLVAHAYSGATTTTSSSGRSTPRSVAFGPLPEPIRPEGAPSRFKEQREAKAKAKARSRSGSRASGNGGKDGKDNKDKEKEGESSWWTTWLTGGSVLSMSASRAEERVEDRIARSWGRPGMLEDWPV